MRRLRCLRAVGARKAQRAVPSLRKGPTSESPIARAMRDLSSGSAGRGGEGGGCLTRSAACSQRLGWHLKRRKCRHLSLPPMASVRCIRPDLTRVASHAGMAQPCSSFIYRSIKAASEGPQTTNSNPRHVCSADANRLRRRPPKVPPKKLAQKTTRPPVCGRRRIASQLRSPPFRVRFSSALSGTAFPIPIG